MRLDTVVCRYRNRKGWSGDADGGDLLAWVQFEALTPDGICNAVVALRAQGQKIRKLLVAERRVAVVRGASVFVMDLE